MVPGIDEYTILMLHCNGTDGSTSFPDDSYSNHTVTASGDTQVDTAQSKFGGASGYFDGSTDYLVSSDHADWDLGSGDFTFDCWLRFDTRIVDSGNYSFILSRWKVGLRGFHFAIRFVDSNYKMHFGYSTNGTNVIPLAGNAITINLDTWYHFAWVRDGNTLRFFQDGIAVGTADLTGVTIYDPTSSIWIGQHDPVTSGHNFKGWIDEFRLSKGIARWTSNFTPPSEEYEHNRTITFEETITLDDDWYLATTPELISFSETITLDDSWEIEETPKTISFGETITLNDSWVFSTFEDTFYVTQLLYYSNHVYYITETSPAKLVDLDISDPTDPIQTVYTFIGYNNAKAFALNTTNNYFYIAVDDGKVLKAEFANPNNFSEIDTSETDDFVNLSVLSDFFKTYISTTNSTGELVVIDEATLSLINTDFRYLTQEEYIVNTQFDYIYGQKINTDFRYLSQQEYIVNTDFRYNEYTPTEAAQNVLARTDFHVYINSVEATDVQLSSINIYHAVDEKSRASFILARKHDDLDRRLDGSSSQITNNNNVQIYIDNHLEFSGQIVDLETNSDNQTVQVTAHADEKEDERKTITLSMTTLNEDLSPYDVLVHNPKIYKPVIDEDDENPEYYKGIRVDLGQRITQNISRYISYTNYASSVREGTFQPKQNRNYFWFARLENPTTGLEMATSRYIGTSPAPIVGDTWYIHSLTYRYQIEYEDDVEDFGYYEVGEAPFKEISVRNGQLITKDRYVDYNDGLYRKKDESYNYVGKMQYSGGSYTTVIKGYAQTVADLEYEKLKNINGDILPKTNANIELMIDGYYFYNPSLLTRINIDNTTQSGIYKNNNGFPIAVKAINISSLSMRVTLICDNEKSLKELEEIEAEEPDQNSDEYIVAEEFVRQFTKFDPNRYETVQ